MVDESQRSDVSIRSGFRGICIVVLASASVALTGWLLAFGMSVLFT